MGNTFVILSLSGEEVRRRGTDAIERRNDPRSHLAYSIDRVVELPPEVCSVPAARGCLGGRKARSRSDRGKHPRPTWGHTCLIVRSAIGPSQAIQRILDSPRRQPG